MMTKEGCTSIVSLMTPPPPRGRGCCARVLRGDKFLMICTLIVIVLTSYNAAFLCHCLFLFYDGHVDTKILALLTRNQCKVSDTLMTVRAHGPLVNSALCT